MEIKNHSKHVIPLIVNKRVAQIVFFYTNPIEKSTMENIEMVMIYII
jgi:hypothetical protein